ncbi:MAG: hypothetical protein N2482_00435 [Patescibacteria group bacterium]|nr:hypothetical protein [Patescibacteria group bacterium]
MKKRFEKLNLFLINSVLAAPVSSNTDVQIGFKIPSLADIIGYAIRLFFIIAGLAALIYLILGAFGWITSSGEKDAVKKAQDKIQAAVIGLIVLVLVLAIIVLIEQVIFNQTVCLGLTCKLQFGSLLKVAPTPGLQ